MPAARAQPPGAPLTAKLTLTAPSPQSPLHHAVKCHVGVVGRRVSIISRVSGSQGSRVNGPRGPNGFKGTKNLRVSGFSRDRGPSHVNRTFLKSGVSKIQSLQGPRDQGFFLGLQGPRVKGIKGFWVPVNPKVSKVQRA